MCTIALGGDILFFWASSCHTQANAICLGRRAPHCLPSLHSLAAQGVQILRIQPGTKGTCHVNSMVAVGLYSCRLGVEGWVFSENKLCPDHGQHTVPCFEISSVYGHGPGTAQALTTGLKGLSPEHIGGIHSPPLEQHTQHHDRT